jgi:hypothetical protein
VCAALDLKARALDMSARRHEAAAAYEHQAQVAGQAGPIQERLHALVSLGRLEVMEGRPPEHLLEARDLSATAGGLVEQAWADFNLAVGLTLQGDPVRGREVAELAARRRCELRLDVLPLLLLPSASAAGFLGS